MSGSGRLAADVLRYALLAIAATWWLGLEQVVPGIVLLVGCWLLWRRGSLSPGLEVWLFLGLVLWSLTSMSALAGRREWLLYARGEIHLLVGLAAYLVASQLAPEHEGFKRWLRDTLRFGVLLVTTSAAVLLGLLSLENPPHLSVWEGVRGVSQFVDDFLVERTLGTSFGVSMLPGIDRQSLYFLYQGGLATVLLLGLGWMLVARQRLRGGWRLAANAGVLASLLLVALTGSRSAVVLAWGVVLALVLWRAIERHAWRRWVVRAVAALMLVGAVLAVIPRGDPGQLHDGAPWERVLVDFRVKSFLDRLEVYQQSIERLNGRPLTGWGIQGRPGERNRYLRLGSHSEPLNVAFRFGWVGLALFLLAILAYLRRFALHRDRRPERVELFLVLCALGLTSLVRTFQWDLNVYWMLMAFLGSAAARPGRPVTPTELHLLGTRLHPRTVDQLHDEIAAAVVSGETKVIGHQNLHGLFLLRRDQDMQRFAERADIVFFDGMAAVWLARGLGHGVERRHRVTYADWLGPLAAECDRRGWRLMHIGGRPGVGESARESLLADYPDLEMSTLPGYFVPAAEAEIRAAIAEFAPQVLMIGMGMPRQEAWVLRNADKIAVPAILTCGACMDYRAGASATPPRWTGRVGLEWLFRLVREPRRLAFRYLVEPWSVLWRYGVEWLTLGTSTESSDVRQDPQRRAPRQDGG